MVWAPLVITLLHGACVRASCVTEIIGDDVVQTSRKHAGAP